MTKFQIYRLSYFSAVFVLSQPVLAQNSLDLQDATAREVAFNLMSDVEQRFSCEMQEHSMRTIGKESDNRYLFMVMTEGEECDDAMLFLTNIAAQDDKLIFRRATAVQEGTGNLQILPGIGQERIENRLILPGIVRDLVLIHEVNPEIGDKEIKEK